MNDDAAEKRRRRKSQKLTMLADEDQPVAGPSEPVSAARGLQRLDSVAEVPAIKVPLDVMSSNFEEWMKLATDNKINAANSWNFALIDYFHDMSLLRNTDDNTINFQRASCTLDGCVKIWTSRVDSVGTDTGKLLSNLAQDGRAGGDDDDADGDEEGGDGSQRAKKSRRGPATTLAKDAAQLKNKKPDLEFNVDPLFKKTCADFDEGGAQGLLMSHLALGITEAGAFRIVFDASDAQARSTDDEADDLQEPVDAFDLAHLRREFFPDLAVLDNKAIAPSLADFTFGQDAVFDDSAFNFSANVGADSDDDDFGGPPPPIGGDMDMDDGALAPALPVEDFFGGDQAIDDGFDGGGADFGGQDDHGSEAGSFVAHAGEYAQGGDAGGGGGRPMPFDPRRQGQPLVVMADDADGGVLDYFDRGFVKNWAGPEHWKLRKPIRKDENAGAASAPRAKREKKEVFKIDFTAPAENSLKETMKELFAPATRGTGLNLPGKSRRSRKSKDKEELKNKDLHLLPDDMHFSSRDLVTLFLKPEFQLRMRGKPIQEADDQEIDAGYWAKAAEAAADAEPGMDAGEPMPFSTQFFNEDDDDDAPGFDDGFEAPVASSAVDDGEQDLLTGSQAPVRRVKPEFVNYAKRAKRVDVRRLKENIWRGLDIVVKDEDTMDEEAAVDQLAETPARPFGDVVSGLRTQYPKERMDEISTSFCFICLLHLANEKGLKLEVGEDGVPGVVDDDGMDGVPAKSDKRVGELWGLKVYRDADAIPAA